MRGPTHAAQRILVVDDNPDTARTLSLLFEACGFEVRTAGDGPDAVAAARAFLPDVILLDIGLPRMDGFEVAAHLRSLPAFRRTFLIAASGYNRDTDRRRAAEVGFDLYLAKPFDPWHVAQLVQARRPAAVAVPA